VAQLALSAASADSQKTGVFLSIRDSDLKKPLKNASRPGMLAEGKGGARESSAIHSIADAFPLGQGKGTDGIGSFTSIARRGWPHMALSRRKLRFLCIVALSLPGIPYKLAGPLGVPRGDRTNGVTGQTVSRPPGAVAFHACICTLMGIVTSFYHSVLL
jgi:hypothetical protein